MIRFQLCFLVVLFSFINEAAAQSRVADGKSSDRIIVKEELPSGNSNPSLIDSRTSTPDMLHDRGEKMKVYLSEPAISSDGLLPEKEFIIERSGQIKIEYKPAMPLNKSKNPY